MGDFRNILPGINGHKPLPVEDIDKLVQKAYGDTHSFLIKNGACLGLDEFQSYFEVDMTKGRLGISPRIPENGEQEALELSFSRYNIPELQKARYGEVPLLTMIYDLVLAQLYLDLGIMELHSGEGDKTQSDLGELGLEGVVREHVRTGGRFGKPTSLVVTSYDLCYNNQKKYLS
ncbi:hypothetical protein JXC34_07240 [Candidatus Woesearchaeota archaeon]|nr:hypothetical protein [Candidatus Woesearchaeota archaeon]